MSVLSSDIKLFLSGGNSNTNPNLSLGGIISTTEVVDNTMNNLFDNVSGVEHAAGDINYRCIYVKNTSAETAYNVRYYIDSNTTAVDDTLNIGKDTVGLNTTATIIVNETTAPSPAVTFTTAVDYANAIQLGDIPAGQFYSLWIKRIVTAGATAQANDTATLKISCDTV